MFTEIASVFVLMARRFSEVCMMLSMICLLLVEIALVFVYISSAMIAPPVKYAPIYVLLL